MKLLFLFREVLVCVARLLIFLNARWFSRQFSKVGRNPCVYNKNMSSAGIQSNIRTKGWSLMNQRILIYVVKKYPIVYLPPAKTSLTKVDKVKLDTAWEEIASKLRQPSIKCKTQWRRIEMRYAKIMILIKTGKVSRAVAMSHPDTSILLDGLLSFLDPYISDMTDDDIHFSIHKSINDKFGLETKRTIKGSPTKITSHFISHAQVKALLTERQLKGDVVDYAHKECLQAVVDIAVERKLEELLLMKNASTNPSNDIINNDDENTVNVTMIPSKNILNKDAENTIKKTINLGLESELILEDDVKIEKEDDIKMEDDENGQDENNVNMQDEKFVIEENLTLDKNINNTTGESYDLENNLPTTIIVPLGQDTQNIPLRGLHENVIVTEDNTDEIMDNVPHVTDDYIRTFFSELGVVMSMELSLDKQKTLKSRINELVKSAFLKELSEM